MTSPSLQAVGSPGFSPHCLQNLDFPSVPRPFRLRTEAATSRVEVLSQLPPCAFPVPSLIRALAGSLVHGRRAGALLSTDQEACQTLALCFLNPQPLWRRGLREKWRGSQKSGGQRAPLGWGGETVQGPGERESPLVPLHRGAGGPRDPGVREDHSTHGWDSHPRWSWLHQSCPQPCVWEQETTTCQRRRECGVMRPAVDTADSQRLWGFCRRPVSTPGAGSVPRERRNPSDREGMCPQLSRKWALGVKSTWPSKKWYFSSQETTGMGFTHGFRPPSWLFNVLFPRLSPVNLLGRRSVPGKH